MGERDTRNDGGIYQRLSSHSQLIPERDAILAPIRRLIEMRERGRACKRAHALQNVSGDMQTYAHFPR